MKKLLTSLLLALPCMLAAQIYTYPLTDSLPNDAHVYHLPKTGLDICFHIRCTQETPGELARYAERFLGQSQVITEQRTTQEIISAEAKTYTMADNDMRFYIMPQAQSKSQSFNKKQSGSTQTLNTICNKDGILLAVNAVPDIIDNESDACENNCAMHAQPQMNEAYIASQTYLTQEMKLANSSLKTAELAARQIFSIRETRLALLHGELENYPTDGEGFKLYLNELNRLEKQYMELFVGHREENIYHIHIQYAPDKDASHDVVCRFSSQNGLVDKDDLSGRPIYCVIEHHEQKHIVQIPDSISTPGKKKTIIKTEEPAGLYYYQPERVKVTLKDGNRMLWHQELTLAQMGHLLRLKTYDGLNVIIDPETGAIIKH